MSSVRVVAQLDRNFAWNGTRLYDDAEFQPGRPVPYELRGPAASVQSNEEGAWRLLRDPLGINKLFWARDENGDIAVAARPNRLVQEGCSFGAIRAIPRGTVVDLKPSEPASSQHAIRPSWFSHEPETKPETETIAADIRAGLDRYLVALASAHPSARPFVCLSGGLDSSGIAALAREHLSGVVAVSFDLERPGGRASEDRAAARRLARDLGLPLIEATSTVDGLAEKLDTVLVEGTDWRDFNVHAALVNAVLAEAIHYASSDWPSSAIVLTGDLANEFLADYRPERYRSEIYYELPRLDLGRLRASLVDGLDTSHREVGVFAAWGLAVVQPYSAVVDAYLALSSDFLHRDDRKQQLSRLVFGKLVPEFVYSRPKVRAQVGSSEDPRMGVLAACVDRGLDGPWLRRRFAYLHGVSDPSELDRFMRAGRYRAAIPSLG